MLMIISFLSIIGTFNEKKQSFKTFVQNYGLKLLLKILIYNITLMIR